MIEPTPEQATKARRYFKELGVNVEVDEYGFKDIDDMLDMPDEPIEWLIDGLLPVGATMLLSGKAGVGKSVLARNAAVEVGRGGYFLGHKCAQGLVCWISAAEESETTFKRHIRKIATKGTRLKYLESPPEMRDRMNWLFNVLENLRPSLLIFDTVVRFLNIVESTSYGTVSAATAPLLDLVRRYRASHLWLHHTNNAGGVHGGGTWERVPDISTLYSANDTGERYLKLLKARDDITLPTTVISYNPETGLTEAKGTRFEADVARAEQAILDSGKFGNRETLAKCGVDRVAGRKALDNLVARGLYVPLSSGRITTYHPADAVGSAENNVIPLSSRDSIYKKRVQRTPASCSDSSEPSESSESSDESIVLFDEYGEPI